MGEVYKARDTRLDRDVAIKIIPEKFAIDAQRVARFQREAKVLASLNHPNIAIIHGLEGRWRPALVMELVEGEDLAQRVKRGAIPLGEALPIARQIANGLEAAHEQGIVHRDLKPANIKVRPDGTVKVLDFGLAKAMEPPATSPGMSQSPTMTSPMMTELGVLLGTAAYMSPEQAKGGDADKRSDIWAFGCVLYEMLTGKRPFQGENLADTLVAVLRTGPDWEALPASVPRPIRRLLHRCLEKERARRLADIADARLDLDEAGSRIGGVGEEPVAIGATRRERLAWMALVMLAVSGAAMAWMFRPATAAADLPLLRFQITTPPTDDPTSFALSPDGRHLAFVANTHDGNTQLWVQSLDQAAARPLAGTSDATLPFWAPDNRAIGFFAQGKLKRVDLTGGTPQEITDAGAGRGASWSRDDIILFANAQGDDLYRVSAAGGPAILVTSIVAGQKGLGLRWPQFLPDGRHFLFFAYLAGPEIQGIYVGSLDGGEPIRVVGSEAAGAFVTPHHLLFVRQDWLVAARFNPALRTVNGDLMRVVGDVGSDVALRRGAFSVSATGLVATRAGRVAQRRQLVWADRGGRVVGTAGPVDELGQAHPELGPDGRRVVVARTVQGNLDVWLDDLGRAVGTRITSAPSAESGAVWSPDGRRIVLDSNRNGVYDLFERSSNGAGEERPLVVTPESKGALSWSRDGRFLLYRSRSVESKTGVDLWALPVDGNRTPLPVATTGFDEDEGQFSPDGHWVAYGFNESGRHEIYVQPFPGPGEKVRVTTDGGSQVRWRPDGKELYYVAPDNRMMAVTATPSEDGQTLRPTAPVALFTTRLARGINIAGTKPQYAVAPDGRFLMNVRIEEQSPITIIQNWTALMQR